jgi:hypothetical protein
MSKQISAAELAEIVAKLMKTDAPDLIHNIALAVCSHAGGEVLDIGLGADDVWYVGIMRGDTLPAGCDSVWAGYDPEGDL